MPKNISEENEIMLSDQRVLLREKGFAPEFIVSKYHEYFDNAKDQYKCSKCKTYEVLGDYDNKYLSLSLYHYDEDAILPSTHIDNKSKDICMHCWVGDNACSRDTVLMCLLERYDYYGFLGNLPSWDSSGKLTEQAQQYAEFWIREEMKWNNKREGTKNRSGGKMATHVAIHDELEVMVSPFRVKLRNHKFSIEGIVAGYHKYFDNNNKKACSKCGKIVCLDDYSDHQLLLNVTNTQPPEGGMNIGKENRICVSCWVGDNTGNRDAIRLCLLERYSLYFTLGETDEDSLIWYDEEKKWKNKQENTPGTAEYVEKALETAVKVCLESKESQEKLVSLNYGVSLTEDALKYVEKVIASLNTNDQMVCTRQGISITEIHSCAKCGKSHGEVLHKDEILKDYEDIKKSKINYVFEILNIGNYFHTDCLSNIVRESISSKRDWDGCMTKLGQLKGIGVSAFKPEPYVNNMLAEMFEVP